MKNMYIAPELTLIEVSMEQMIAESIQNSGKSTGEGGVTAGDVKANNRTGRDLWNEEW